MNISVSTQKLAHYEITYTIENPLLAASTLPVELTCSSGDEPIEIRSGVHVIQIPKSQAFELIRIIERFREFIFEEEAQQRKELERQKYSMQLNSTQGHVSASQVIGQRSCGAAYSTPPAPYDFPDK